MNIKHILFTKLILLVSIIGIKAQNLGDLDKNFGADGFVFANYEEDSLERLNDLIVLQSKKVLLGGYINQSGDDNLLLGRLNKNGTVDPNFGTKGYWFFDINEGSRDRITAMIELSDKKIILVGSTTKNGITQGFIMRLNSNGTLDKSYGEGSKGYSLFNAGSNKSCRPADAELYQNSIYIAATVWTDDNNYDMGLFKFNASGALVNSFASGGSNIVHLKGSEIVHCLDVSSDGHFIIGGTSTKNGTQYGALLRLNQFGLKTSSFDGAGYLVFNHGGDFNIITDVAFDSKDRIVAVGFEGSAPDVNGLIYRFDKNGLPDESFASNGMTKSDIGAANGVYLRSLLVDKNDQLICSGYLYGQSFNDFYVLKLSEKGTAHPDFGSQGDVNYPIGENASYIAVQASAIQADGNILLGATTTIKGYDAYNMTASRVHHWSDVATANTLTTHVQDLKVWPNPVKEILHIDLDAQNIEALELYDLQGRMIKSWESTNGKNTFFMPNNLESGSYVIRCIIDHALYTQRILVH